MGTSVLSPPISAHSARADAGHDEDAAPAPAVGEDARWHLDDRDDGGVGGGHHADRRRVEADLAHEQLLDRHPEHEALQGDREVQGQQSPLQRGPEPGGLSRGGWSQGGHEVSSGLARRRWCRSVGRGWRLGHDCGRRVRFRACQGLSAAAVKRSGRGGGEDAVGVVGRLDAVRGARRPSRTPPRGRLRRRGRRS